MYSRHFQNTISKNILFCDVTHHRCSSSSVLLNGAFYSYFKSAIVYHNSNISIFFVILGNNEVPEYCQHDTFNATCPQGMVIMMKSAQYGRMRLGRCLTRGYGAMGCAADVLEYVDTRCSGRTSCTMEVSDIPKQGYRPCSDDLSYYLEATYGCVKGMSILV